MIDFKSLVKELIDANVARPSEVNGCSEYDIRQLETDLGIRLPVRYCEFLKLMGYSAGRFFLGTDIFFQHLRSLQGGASRLLRDDGQQPLPEQAFVFGMHQGYQFVFFLLNQGDDPPVSGYLEKKGFSEISTSFSEYLAKAVRDTIGIRPPR